MKKITDEHGCCIPKDYTRKEKVALYAKKTADTNSYQLKEHNTLVMNRSELIAYIGAKKRGKKVILD